VFARLYLETGDAHRAEDLAQETFLSAFRSVRSLANAAGFRAWLMKIAQNVALDAARRDLRQKRAGTPLPGNVFPDVAGRTDGPEERLERQELRGQVLAALRSLPEEYRL